MGKFTKYTFAVTCSQSLTVDGTGVPPLTTSWTVNVTVTSTSYSHARRCAVRHIRGIGTNPEDQVSISDIKVIEITELNPANNNH